MGVRGGNILFEYAAVVVDLPKIIEKKVLHYIIPAPLSNAIQPGCRVLVPVGKQVKEGFVIDIPLTTSIENPKHIKELIDTEPIVSRELLKLALWTSETYLSPLYKVLEYIIPPYARNLSVQWAKLTVPLGDTHFLTLLDQEIRQVVKYLEGGPKKVAALKAKFGNNIEILLKDLELRKIIEIYYDYEQKGKRKYITLVKATINIEDINLVLEKLKRAKKQQDIIKYLAEHGPMDVPSLCQLLQTNIATINSLEAKGLVEKKTVEQLRIPPVAKEFQKDTPINYNL